MAQSHLIYRQVLDVTFPSKKEAMEGQERLSQFYRHELTRLISEVFDEVLPSGEYLRIDRLELDLGQVSRHNFEEEVRQQLRSQLEDELLQNLREVRLVRSTYLKNRRNGDHYQPGGAGSEPAFSDNADLRSEESQYLELFTFFVKTGQLPWWTSRQEWQSLEDIASTILGNQPDRLLPVLQQLLRSDTYSRRIIHQFPDHILAQFIALKWDASGGLTAVDVEQVQQLHEDLFRIHRVTPLVSLAPANLRLFAWQMAFDHWVTAEKFPTVRPNYSILRPDSDPQSPSPLSPFEPDSEGQKRSRLLFQLIPKSPLQHYLVVLLKALAKKLNENIDARNIPGISSAEITPLLHRLVQGMQDLGIKNRVLGKALSVMTELSPEELQQAFANIALKQSRTTPRQGQSEIELREDQEQERREAKKLLWDQDHFEIQNAGLVILAPFLPRFFDALGLVSEKEFVTDEAAIRGALLLQFIATGETEMPEHELILNKILCGLPVDEPLPRSLEISDPEAEESENLLESVIEHWEALKSTSIDGLRQTFLIKDGLLSIEENGWKLRVERTTVDVLLDRLPWSISIIKLPWNDDMLHVEW